MEVADFFDFFNNHLYSVFVDTSTMTVHHIADTYGGLADVGPDFIVYDFYHVSGDVYYIEIFGYDDQNNQNYYYKGEFSGIY